MGQERDRRTEEVVGLFFLAYVAHIYTKPYTSQTNCVRLKHTFGTSIAQKYITLHVNGKSV